MVPYLKSTATTVIAASLATSVFAEDIVKIDGSSTVYPITEAVAEEFQKETGIKVTVGVSGTGGGFKKFCRGETVISEASRPIKAKEIAKCYHQFRGIRLPQQTTCAFYFLNRMVIF
jgi:phosphate transport system substrate-binding protein